MSLEKTKTIGIMMLITLVIVVVFVVMTISTKETLTTSDGKTATITKKVFSFGKTA